MVKGLDSVGLSYCSQQYSITIQVLTWLKKEKRPTNVDLFSLVGMKGLEPSRPEALVPKTSVSTNSTTSPWLMQISIAYYACFVIDFSS